MMPRKVLKVNKVRNRTFFAAEKSKIKFLGVGSTSGGSQAVKSVAYGQPHLRFLRFYRHKRFDRQQDPKQVLRHTS